MKKIISVLLILVLATTFLVSCGTDPLVGTWTGSMEESGIKIEFKYVFDKDGTGSMEAMDMAVDMKYKTDGDKLKITSTVMEEKTTETYTYSIKDNKLSLKMDGVTIVLTKKK